MRLSYGVRKPKKHSVLNKVIIIYGKHGKIQIFNNPIIKEQLLLYTY